MTVREKGPVEILCREIDFRFWRHMETKEIYLAFVSRLVREVADMRGMQVRITEIPGVNKISHPMPSDASAEVLRQVESMLELAKIAKTDQTLIEAAASVHDYIHEVAPDEAEPCDHLIDMLSSCVSAVRFGFEKPCHSRHAAEASNHIWRKRYGLTLEDEHTPRWSKDWARAQLQDAITGLALTCRPCRHEQKGKT